MLLRELAISQQAPSSQDLLTKGALKYAEKQAAADTKVRLNLLGETCGACGKTRLPGLAGHTLSLLLDCERASML